MVKCDYLYKPETFIEKINKNHLSNKKLNFKIIDNGTILPHKNVPGTVGFGGITDNEGNFLEESFVHHGIKGVYTPNEKVEYIPTSVIYFGMAAPIWGHVITDNIKRAWFFYSDVYKRYFKNFPIAYTPMCVGGGGKNFTKILEILEIPPTKLIPITKPTKFLCIILPEESFTFTYFTNEFEETVERLRNFALKNFKPLSQKKFYFFHGRNQIGEERIANYFYSKGYAIIRPEQIPFEEQLNIYANCQNFASSLGSIAHNTIFTRNGTEAIFIPRVPVSFVPIPHQLLINSMRNLNANYIDSTLSSYMINYTGPYCYIISKQLKKFFGDKFDNGYSEDDFKIFLQYVRYSLVNKLKENINAKNYYSSIIQEFYSQLVQRKDLMEKFGITIK